MKNTPRQNASQEVRNAYDEFKGGCETVIESKKMLESVETARTNGVILADETLINDAVWVYLVDGYENVPDVVERAANRNNLVEVKREKTDEENIEKVCYAKESLTCLND